MLGGMAIGMGWITPRAFVELSGQHGEFPPLHCNLAATSLGPLQCLHQDGRAVGRPKKSLRVRFPPEKGSLRECLKDWANKVAAPGWGKSKARGASARR